MNTEGDSTNRPGSTVSHERPPVDPGGPLRSRSRPCSRLPKLRSDLVVSEQHAESGASFVIKDPANGAFFRFKEPEHFIAKQLDGTTPHDEVRRRVSEKFEVALDEQTLASFVKTLQKARLLETDGAAEKARPPEKQKGWVRGNLLYLRFKGFDPNRILNWLAGRLRFLYTAAFMVVSASLILTACGVMVFNWEDFGQDIGNLYRWSALPVVWAVILLVTAAHEFGHGLTCKHFGGEVHEMGFLMIYFQPAMYCNVSDAWMFPEKSKRLWVTFAGPYFELFLWALAVLTWRVTDPETTLNFVALAVTVTSGVKNLMNFNPLIKMDGYYLLSDYLEIPNLRKRAYAGIGAMMKKMFGVKAAIEGSPREVKILLTYGIIAFGFSVWFLGFMFFRLGNFLVERNQGPAGLAVLVFLFLLKIRRRIRRLFPETAAGIKSLKKGMDLMKKPLLLTLLAAAALNAAYFGSMELKVTGPFRVLPIHNSDVRVEVEGLVEKIMVDEGDTVKAGDLIALLSDRDNLAELRKTEAAIDEAQARLRLLEAGARPEEIEQARTTVWKAEERVKFADSRLQRDKPLFEEKLLSGKDFEDTQANYADRNNELAEAKSKLDILMAGSRREDMDATRAEIARLQAQKGYLGEQLKLVRVVSPIPGIVTTPSRQLKGMIHQLVKKGDLIAKVFEMRTIEAETPVSEREIADVKVGERVALKVRAYPEMTFFGKVTSIATTAQTGAPDVKDAPTPVSFNGRTILVTTQIDNTALLLKPEMTGNAKILCGEHRVIDVIHRRVAHTFKVEFWSWW